MFMLFSATMGERLEALAAQFMHEPLEVKIENDTETADTIEQVGYFVDEDGKSRQCHGFLRYKRDGRGTILPFEKRRHCMWYASWYD